jgi:hypothetical protein
MGRRTDKSHADHFLDLLDMVLLGCLFLLAVSSLVFNEALVASEGRNWVLLGWVTPVLPTLPLTAADRAVQFNWSVMGEFRVAAHK